MSCPMQSHLQRPELADLSSQVPSARALGATMHLAKGVLLVQGSSVQSPPRKQAEEEASRGLLAGTQLRH